MIRDLVDTISKRVDNAIFCDMTDEQKGYAAGLADALEVVKFYDEKHLEVGKIYYVIVHEDNGMSFHVSAMKLYKITITESRITYNFSNKIRNENVSLSSEVGLAKRVFKTSAEANLGLKTYVPFDPQFSKFRRSK